MNWNVYFFLIDFTILRHCANPLRLRLIPRIRLYICRIRGMSTRANASGRTGGGVLQFNVSQIKSNTAVMLFRTLWFQQPS